MFMFNKTKYERIRAEGKTFFARILNESEGFLYFRKVNKFGDETEEKMENGVNVIQEHMMEKGLITKRTPMKMSLMYAELEPE